MEFRKATQADLDYVRLNPFEDAVKDYPYMQIPDENCYTGIFEGKIVGVGGLNKWREGVGLLWLMLAKDFKKAGSHSTLHAIKDHIELLIQKNNLWRAEAHIRVDFPQAIKMVEFLGFQREGTMRLFFPDKTDGYLYSRIIK